MAVKVAGAALAQDSPILPLDRLTMPTVRRVQLSSSQIEESVMATRPNEARPVQVKAGSENIEGSLVVPDQARGIVIFALGSTGDRQTRADHHMAELLNEAGFATLMMELLTPQERAKDDETAELRFNGRLLADRLLATTHWVEQSDDTKGFGIGYFAAGADAAAAFIAAADAADTIRAIVARAGRPDLADHVLPRVKAATLLIVGAEDLAALNINKEAMLKLQCEKSMVVISGTSVIFEKLEILEEIGARAREWYESHLLTGGVGAGQPQPNQGAQPPHGEARP
jgi:dienelactone hydrolase